MAANATATKQQRLLDWIVSRGGSIHPDLNLFHDIGSGERGVCATKPIKKGVRLLLLPESCCVHIPNDSEWEEAAPTASEAVLHLRQLQPPMSPFLAMTALLMHEMAKGDASQMAPYLDSLPAHVDCLLTWGPEDKEWLAGTAIEDLGDTPQAMFQRELSARLAAAPQLWPPQQCGYEAFVLAACLVQSRAFHMMQENWVTGTRVEGTELYLLPGIDMLNHSTDPDRRSSLLQRIHPGAPNARITTPLPGGKDVTFRGFFTMSAERDIAEGEEVLHTYGDLSDGQLLATYGFLDCPKPGLNPHSFALLPWSTLLAACRTLAPDLVRGKLEGSKREFLAAWGLLQPAAPDRTDFVVSALLPLPSDLLTAAQVLLLMRSEFHELRKEHPPPAAAAGPSSSAAGGDPGVEGPRLRLGNVLLEDPQFRHMVCAALLKALDACQKRYPTTLQQDLALLERKAAGGEQELGQRQRFAALVRAGEKQLLGEAKRAVVEMMMGGSDDEEDEDEVEGGEDEEDEDEAEQEDVEDDAGKGGLHKKRRRAAGQEGGEGGSINYVAVQHGAHPGLGSRGEKRQRGPKAGHPGLGVKPSEEDDEALESDASDDMVGYADTAFDDAEAREAAEAAAKLDEEPEDLEDSDEVVGYSDQE